MLNFSDVIYTIHTIPKMPIPQYECTEKKNIEYIELPCSFDIETSSFYNKNNEKTAIMYNWQLQIKENTIIGRTWKEFFDVLQILQRIFKISSKRILTVYVHNLSFEFQFMRKWFEWKKVFAIKRRTPISALTNDGILFKCSYILSGLSLEKVAENLTKHKIQKLVGDLDYSKIRHSETEIKKSELPYMVNDVRIVVAYIWELMEKEGSITKIPLTATGFVRRHCKEILTKNKKYLKKIKSLTLEPEEYNIVRRSFIGGFTHANFNSIGKIFENVASFDFTSSYPFVMLTQYFPMSKGVKVKIESLEQAKEYLKEYCCIFKVRFTNLKAKPGIPDNYLSFSKIEEKITDDAILNNGRIYSTPQATVCITEIDFDIICKTYTFDTVQFADFYIYNRGYLPKEFMEIILELYKNKTELKGVLGKEEEYLKSKGMLNSLYGMAVTNIIREENKYFDDWEEPEYPEIEKAINSYNNQYGRFLFYPWGVYVTAHARRNLWTGILACGNDYKYSDTDSIKITNYEKHLDYIEKYNARCIDLIKKVCEWYKFNFEDFEPTDINGKKHLIGVWDFEGVYNRFKTLGAKRYITEKNNKITLTCAGVGKKAGANYLQKTYGEKAIEHFTNKLIFPVGECGKLTHTYIDDPKTGYVKDYNGNVGKYCELSSVHLENGFYNMNLAENFIEFLYMIGGYIID